MKLYPSIAGPLLGLFFVLPTAVLPVSADVSLTFGNNANENKEVSDIITKNAKPLRQLTRFLVAIYGSVNSS